MTSMNRGSRGSMEGGSCHNKVSGYADEFPAAAGAGGDQDGNDPGKDVKLPVLSAPGELRPPSSRDGEGLDVGAGFMANLGNHGQFFG